MTSYGEIQSLLECPVCLHGMYRPIFQCSNGHALCFVCFAKVGNRCPVCREVLGNTKCGALEKLSELVELPCRFENLGCQGSFTCWDRLEHERGCTFRPYSCPYSGPYLEPECPMKNGDIRSIIAHLKKDHVIDLRESCTFKHTTSVVPVHMTWISALICRPMLVFNCFGNHFCLQFEPIPSEMDVSKVLVFLRLMGEDGQAMRFRYRVKVNGDGSKFFWQGVPRNIRESRKNLLETLQGLIICRELPDYNPFEEFPRETVKMSIRIWEEEQS